MQVNQIQSNQQSFNAKFLPSKALDDMLLNSGKLDRKTIRAAKKFAGKHKSHELIIDKFERAKGYFDVVVQNPDTSYKNRFSYLIGDNFPLREFLKDVTAQDWLYSLDNMVKVKRMISAKK